MEEEARKFLKSIKVDVNTKVGDKSLAAILSGFGFRIEFLTEQKQKNKR